MRDELEDAFIVDYLLAVNALRLTGTVFAFRTECCSDSDRNGVRLRPDSPLACNLTRVKNNTSVLSLNIDPI